ncbi:MAG: dihydroorotase [Flammeovirgaceae bacterium]
MYLICKILEKFNFIETKNFNEPFFQQLIAEKLMSQALLLKKIRIICPSSPYHKTRQDLLIEHGSISQIGEIQKYPNDAKVVDASDWSVSAGWCDLRAVVCEPGFEGQDDVLSLCRSAAAGGFTDLAVLPNSQPVIQHKESIFFLKTKSAYSPVSLHPIAALTTNTKGEELAEMYDMHLSGAVAFSDGLCATTHEGVIMRALQYLQSFGGLMMNLPSVNHLGKGGQMHEGEMSVRLGMKGIPSLVEEMAIQRDLKILEYTGGKIHFSCISSKEGVALVRNAKSQGLAVTCDISANHLYFTDNDLFDFDTSLKVMPPFRSKTDQEALWKGLADGTIDAICTNHHPLDQESKALEFDLAAEGILGLETAFGAIMSKKPDFISTETIIEKLSTSPREILRIAQPKIAEGKPANLTIFAENDVWTVQAKDICSKSINTPFIGKKLKGRVLGIINRGQMSLKF